jgi:hypothetical protein
VWIKATEMVGVRLTTKEGQRLLDALVERCADYTDGSGCRASRYNASAMARIAPALTARSIIAC